MPAVAKNLRESCALIDRQWPFLKYCSLGLYSAWILLMMSSTAVIHAPGNGVTGQLHNIMYLSSGIPLFAVLVGFGLAHKKTERFVIDGPLTYIGGALATIGTFVAMGGFGDSVPIAVFVVASAFTGVGTALLCLRLGYMFSQTRSRNVFFNVFAAAIIGNFIYFMAACLSDFWGVVILSLLPISSALLCSLKQARPKKSEEDQVPIEMLPKGFFARSMFIIIVFSMAVGVVKGLSVLRIGADVLAHASILSVFVSFAVALTLLVAFALILSVKHFEIAKLYYPIAVISCMAIFIMPFVGETGRLAALVVTEVGYNIFILAVWCMLSNIAGQTTLSSTYVFGIGRGGSGFGNTAGQMTVVVIAAFAPQFLENLGAVSIVLAVVAIVMMAFTIGEGTVIAALNKMHRQKEDAEIAVALAETGEKPRVSAWEALCAGIAEEFGLTAREKETLQLVGRGNTASFIAEEMGVSYNTIKGHIRNLYAKCGVHSRQELLNLIELRERAK